MYCQIGSHRHYDRFLITVLHQNSGLTRAGTGTKRLENWNFKKKSSVPTCSNWSSVLAQNTDSTALLILTTSGLQICTNTIWSKLWTFSPVSHFPHLVVDSWTVCHGGPKTFSLGVERATATLKLLMVIGEGHSLPLREDYIYIFCAGA